MTGPSRLLTLVDIYSMTDPIYNHITRASSGISQTQLFNTNPLHQMPRLDIHARAGSRKANTSERVKIEHDVGP